MLTLGHGLGLQGRGQLGVGPGFRFVGPRGPWGHLAWWPPVQRPEPSILAEAFSFVAEHRFYLRNVNSEGSSM